MNREKAAARVYLGTDGTLGAAGGAPGVDIATLFGVATTKTQGDVQALEDALYSGLYVPFTAINFGDSKHAPRLQFAMPDSDAHSRVTELSAARAAFLDAIDRYNQAGFEMNQDIVIKLAADYGVDAPLLAGNENQRVSLELAPTTIAKIVRVREARSSQGLPPFGDDRDDLTLIELEERVKARAAAAVNAADSGNGAPTPDPAKSIA